MRKKSGEVKRKRKRKLLITELLVITGVVAAAFFIPQFLFYVQDRILWGGQELSRREGMDVEALSSTYEKSLYRRMYNYAEGLAAGEAYYVTSRDLTVDSEVYEYLYSDSGLYYGELLSSEEVIPWVFRDQMVTVSEWKQYVIYSDNYAKGVNYILWYIEMEGYEDIRLKLLADAETRTLYALKLENCEWLSYDENVADYYYYYISEAKLELWYYFGQYYECFDSEEDFFRQLLEKSGMNIEYGEETDMGINIDEERFRAEIFAQVRENVQVNKEDEYHVMELKLDYGEFPLKVLLKRRDRHEGLQEDNDEAYYYVYPDTIIGVKEIYEMIPEFL